MKTRSQIIAAAILSLGLTVAAQAQSPRDPFHEGAQAEQHRNHGKPTVHLPDARDPFAMEGRVSHDRPIAPPLPHVPPPAPAPVAQAPAEKVVLPSVHGILESPKGNTALLVASDRTFIVGTGQKLGDYRVTHIDGHGVRLSYAGKSYTLPLDSTKRSRPRG